MSSEFRVQCLGFKVFCFAFLTISYTLNPIPSIYGTWLGGFYELEYASDKKSDFDWNLRLPRHYLQLKMYTNPVLGVDLYSQVAARTDEPWYKKDEVFLERLWGKYWFGKSRILKGEVIVSAKEERHFYDSPLLQLVNIDKASDKRAWWDLPRAQSIRLNFWDVGKFKGFMLLSKNEPKSKEKWYNSNFDVSTEVRISRLTMNLLKAEFESCDLSIGYIARLTNIDKFDLNNQYLTTISSENYVYTTDLKFITKPGSLFIEYAQNANFSKNNYAAAIEFRDIILGPMKLILRGYNYGRDFRAELSERFSARKADFGLKTDPEFGRTGLYTEVIYMLPPKMVNVTYKGSFYRTQLDTVKDNESLVGAYNAFYGSEYVNIWNYIDLYTEFVRGIKSKIALEQLTDKYGTFPTVLLELQGESQIGYGRFQIRLKDINSKRELGERLIYGTELKANLTDRLQAYHRTVIVQSNYLQKTWSSSFYQIRYNIIPDIETYIEYGDGWQTDWLTYDDDIIKKPEIEMVHTVKLILKVNF